VGDGSAAEPAGRVVTVALVAVPGPGGGVTFVRQERGPYAGFWVLPGGKVEFAEPIAEAARRETMEESGCNVSHLALTGAYEIFGPDHHFVVWAYRSEHAGLPRGRSGGHHVSGVRQEHWDRIEPHPTDMLILNDAGCAAYPRLLIENRLAAARIRMANLLTEESYGRAAGPVRP
jgi:ADP-ribose pyrophosphatase YjhB (NUDIX family)